jgi:lambda family phage portal protein
MNEQQIKENLAALAQQHKAEQSVSPNDWEGGSLYKLGKPSKRHAIAPMQSADSAVMQGDFYITRRMRELAVNSPQVKRPIDLFRDLIIGSGINAYSDPIDYSFGWDFARRSEADLFRSFDYALETDEKFLRWASDPELCDVEGVQNFFDMQRLTLSDTATVGDVILKFVFVNDPDSQVPFKLQLIERENLDRSKDRPSGKGVNKIVNGIEFDENNFEVGAWIYDQHPYDIGFNGIGSGNSTFIPSSMYVRFYQKSRPSQHIGTTWLPATAQTNIDRDKLIEMIIRKAIKQAQHVLVRKTNRSPGMDAGLLTPDDASDYEGPSPIALGTNPLAMEIGLEEELELVETPDNAQGINELFSVLDHDASAAANLSYYTATGRFNETNYGGFKGAMNLESAQMKPVQNTAANRIVLPIRRLWNDLAMAFGHINAITPSRYERERDRFRQFDCIGPGREWLDPEKEYEASSGKLRGGLTTLKIECATRGIHWIRVLRQMKLETTIADKLGIVLDHSKGQGGQVSKSTRSSKESDAVQEILQKIYG